MGPAQGIHAGKDVASSDGFVAAVEDEIATSEVSETRIPAQLNISSQGMLTAEIGEFEIRDSVHQAIERGVVLEVGHGASSFNWKTVESAMEQGILPTTISSDLHIYNLNGPVYDLAAVVTKFLHLGMPLDDAIDRVTSVQDTGHATPEFSVWSPKFCR